MATNYPGALDTTANLPDTITDSVATLTVHAQYHNNVNDAVLAIENTLGANPQGSFATVVARLGNAVYQTPGNGSQVIKPSLDERAFVLRPFSDTQTNKIVEVQNAAGSAVTAYIDKTGNASFASLAIAGTALASTNLSDTGNLARITTTNTFTQAQTISAGGGLTLSGAGAKTLLSITATTGNPGLTIGGDTTLYRSAANTLATDDTLLFPQAAATTVVLQTTVAGVLTSQLKAGGAIEWANGTGAVDTNWYRRGVSLVGTDYTVDVALEVVSRSGATAQTKIGAVGPANQAGILLGTTGTFTLYLSGSNTVTTTGTITAATFNATTGFQVNGVALASSNLSDGSTLAKLASPGLTGVPTAPTAAVDTNTSQIATTAFVLAQASSTTPAMNGTGTIGTSTRFARADHIHPTDTTRAPLASPAFTGTPTAPTATALNNSTQVATTAYVDSAVSAGVPTGTVMPYAGSTAPTGYLMADNSTVSRTTYVNLMNVITFTQTVTTTNASASVTVSDSSVMFVGMPVEGTGIPASATVASIVDATHITISANATASGSPTARFFPHGNGDGSTTFNVIDLRGRTVHGKGTHASVNALGKNEGVAVASRTPLHSHGVGTLVAATEGAHTHGPGTYSISGGSHGHGITDNGHSHGYSGGPIYTDTAIPYSMGSGGSTTVPNQPSGSLSINSATTGISINAATHSHPSGEWSGNSGAGSAHTHTLSGSVGTTSSAPAESAAFLVLNYIVKT